MRQWLCLDTLLRQGEGVFDRICYPTLFLRNGICGTHVEEDARNARRLDEQGVRPDPGKPIAVPAKPGAP